MRSIIQTVTELWANKYVRWTLETIAWIVGLAAALWYGALGMLYLVIFTLIFPWLVWPETAILIGLLLTIFILSRKNR